MMSRGSFFCVSTCDGEHEITRKEEREENERGKRGET